MKIKCIAIDDEPLALKQMEDYIRQTPFLGLIALCRSAFEAMEILNTSTEIQLIFVDINMPKLSGMDFVKSLTNKPHIVFTTAYSEYAIDGFQVEATDYLLKPIAYPAFLNAANKVKKQVELTQKPPAETLKTTQEHLFVKSEHKIIRVELADIKYIESSQEYVKIYLVNTKIVMTLLSMKALEEQLPTDKFMRVHRSFIVNLSKISIIERNRIIFDEKVFIPVSEQYKEAFQQYLNNFFV